MNGDISSYHMKTRSKGGQNTRVYQSRKTKNAKLRVKFKVPSELRYIIDEAHQYHDSEYLANVLKEVQLELPSERDAESTYFEPVTDNDRLSDNLLTDEDYEDDEDDEVDDQFTDESSIQRTVETLLGPLSSVDPDKRDFHLS